MKSPGLQSKPQIRFAWVIQILILVTFSLGLAIRLFDLTDLPLDFHPTRQLRSAIIARGIFATMQPYSDANQQAAALQAMNSLEDYEPPIL